MKLAILINVKDRASEVALLLQSLRTSNYQDFDVYILDESSTPLTNYHFFNCIVNLLKQENHKVFIKSNEIKKGVTHARQTIVNWVKSLPFEYEYYCRLDDDCTIEQDYINQLIKFGDNLYGFQINFELTEDLLEYFLNLLPELNISSKERIEKDYTEIKERYLEKGERIFTNYLKLINLIKQIEVELIENSVKSENKKKSDNLPPHSEDKPKIIEGERSTSINLDDLKKKMESKLTKS